MKKKIFIGMMTFFMIVSMVSGIGAKASADSNNRLQYFGYYGADGSSPGNPTDDYLQIIGNMGNSNVALIHGWLYGQRLRDTIETAASKNMKVILHVYDIFFAYDAVLRGYLVGPWEQNWQTLKETLSGLEDNVLAFYFDEPWLAGVSEADFRFVTKLIREDFPDKKVMQVSALADLDPGNTGEGMKSSYLDFVTDVGFDYYNAWNVDEYVLYNDKLKALANKNQDIWFIPMAFSRKNTSDGLQQELLRHYELALKEPRVVGIIPFNFPSGGDWGKGLEYFFDETIPSYDSYLKNTHIQVGKSIVANAGKNDNIYEASLDYSSVQGENGWFYQEGGDSSYTDLNWNAGGNVWKGTNPLVTVGSNSQSPGAKDSIRKWVAPKSGTIQIATNGNIRKNGITGDGVRIKLLKNNTKIWPEDSEWKSLPNNDTTGFTMKTTIEVQAGDSLYFVVNQNGNSTDDQTFWNPVIIYKTNVEAFAMLSGPPTAHVGEAVNMQIGIAGDPLNFTALQGVLSYDPDKLQFNTQTIILENNQGTAQALADDAYTNERTGFQLLTSKVNAAEGKIYITMASTSAGDVIKAGGNLLALHGTVKSSAAMGTTAVAVADLKVSHEGTNANAKGALFSIKLDVKEPVDPNELLINHGFENGLTGWESFYTASLTTVASPVDSGSNALKISARSSNYTGAMQDITATLLENGKGIYDFGAMLRTESDTQTMYVNIFLNDSEGEHYFNGSFVSVGSGSWVKSSGSAPLTWTGELKKARIYMESFVETGKGNYYVDNVSLKKKPLLASDRSLLTTSVNSIPGGAKFTVNYGLSAVGQAVFAQDIKLDYDPTLMEFVSAKSLIDGIVIYELVKTPVGKLRLIVASQGAGHAVTGSAQVVELTFKAKTVLQTRSGNIAITSAALGNDQGNETQAELASIRMEVKADDLVGNSTDINQDGKVTVGDLSFLSAHYGKDISSADWEQVKKADINGDGSIDILDLAAVAKKLIE